MKKQGTVVLVVRKEPDIEQPILIDVLSDDQEIQTIELAIRRGDNDPLASVYGRRADQQREEDEFGEYVEELLSQPFLKPEIQTHGVEWLKSRIRMEKFQRMEAEATQVIATFAFKMYEADTARTDFVLVGPSAKVRVRVVEVAVPTPAVMGGAA